MIFGSKKKKVFLGAWRIFAICARHRICEDAPIFSTGKEELMYVRGRVFDERGTEVMRVQWKIFSIVSLQNLSCFNASRI